MRTCMASTREAFFDDHASGRKLVVAPFAAASAPTVARFIDCRLPVT